MKFYGCGSELTDVYILAVDFGHEVIHPSLITSTCGRVPSVDEVEFGTDLIAYSSWCALGVKDAGKSASRVKTPVRVHRVVVQV